MLSSSVLRLLEGFSRKHLLVVAALLSVWLFPVVGPGGSFPWGALLQSPVGRPEGAAGLLPPVTPISPCRMAEPRFNNPYFWPPPPTMPSQVRRVFGEEGEPMEQGTSDLSASTPASWTTSS